MIAIGFIGANSLASDEVFQIDGIFYEVIRGTSEVRVTYDPSKFGKDQFGQPIGNTYSGIVTVPPQITHEGTTYTVSEIGKWAFAGGPGLTAVNLPESITKIDDGGFYMNEGLTSITLPSSLKTLELYAFRNCYNLSSINFPEGLEYIGTDAFTHDYALTELILPSSLKTIQPFAFCMCTGVRTLILEDADEPLNKPDSWDISTIFDCMKVDYAYLGRPGETGDYPNDNPIKIDAKELVFGGTLFTTVTDRNFNPATLEKLTIPASVTNIPSGTFKECVSLRDVKLEDGETPLAIGKSATSGMEGLSAFYFCPLDTAYIGRLTETDPNTALPFSYCKTLRHLTVGPSQSSLPDYSFLRCEGLEMAVLPQTLTNLGEGCFSDCYSLSEIDLPLLIEDIPYRAFDSCSSLRKVNFNSGLKNIGELAFSSCPIEELNLPSTLKTVGRWAFASNRMIRSLVLPEGIETIGQNAFSNCKNLIDLTIPGSVTMIGENAFNGMASLKNLKFANSEEELSLSYSRSGSPSNVMEANSIFSGSTAALENVYIGRDFKWSSYSNNLQTTYRYNNMWGNYPSLSEKVNIVYGPLVFATSEGMFYKFDNIETVVCLGTQKIPFYRDKTFYRTGDISLFVPEGLVETYVDSYSWKGFRDVTSPYFSLSDSEITLGIGQSYELNLSRIPDIPGLGPWPEVVWMSSDPTVAFIDNGIVTAHSTGTSFIHALSEDDMRTLGECVVTVSGASKVEVGIEDHISVAGTDYEISISGIPADRKIFIYNPEGMLIKRLTGNGGILTYSPCSPGLYIITVEGEAKAYKVKL